MQDKLATHYERARALWRWLCRHAVPPTTPAGAQAVRAPLFPKHPGLEEALLLRTPGTFAERLALLFVALCKVRPEQLLLSPTLFCRRALRHSCLLTSLHA